MQILKYWNICSLGATGITNQYLKFGLTQLTATQLTAYRQFYISEHFGFLICLFVNIQKLVEYWYTILEYWSIHWIASLLFNSNLLNYLNFKYFFYLLRKMFAFQHLDHSLKTSSMRTRRHYDQWIPQWTHYFIHILLQLSFQLKYNSLYVISNNALTVLPAWSAKLFFNSQQKASSKK